MTTTTRKIDLNIEVDVLTAGLAAEIVNAILEFLLYQRNQIPFVCKTFNYYVGKCLEQQMEESNVHSFQLECQRKQAKQTKDDISAMQKLICSSFERNAIKRLRFLFGATTFTPKESYTIHIPLEAMEHTHHHAQHRLSHGRLSQTLLSLLTSEDLYSIFSNNLSPTNLYLELEMFKDTNASTVTTTASDLKVFPKEFYQLPNSCKDVHLHLLHAPPLDAPEKLLFCCKELHIFEDVADCCNQQEQPEVNAPVWWEADIIVRGFKEKPIRGVSIWSN